MGVSRFQPVKDEDQQNATQCDPAPEPAHFELCPMNDTHNLVPAPNQNIARVQSSINRDPSIRWFLFFATARTISSQQSRPFDCRLLQSI